MIADPSLMLQKAVRARLTAFSDLTAIVPASAIHDAWRRPEASSCIIMGEGQTVLDDRFMARNVVNVFLDLHAWTKGADLAHTKAVTGAIGAALAGTAPTLAAGRCIDFRIAHTRFLRDPGNEWGHAVVSIEALVDTLASGPAIATGATPAPTALSTSQVEFDFNAQSVWTMKHNLNRRPTVLALDTAGEEIGGDLRYIDANTAEISYAFPVTGKAYLS